MQQYEFIFIMMLVSILAMHTAGLWYAIASWWKYRFSLWWWLGIAILLLAPAFIFPLCSELRYYAARKQKRPQPEIKRNLLYKKMSWVLVLCYALTAAVTQAVLKAVMPETSDIYGLSFVLVTITVMIASVASLWIVRQK